ncbi:hypothetical protein [Actinomadura rupiterrae]|uniref:hypothetical protein n=1 Tax=Actinomadura rupiterrae TaxID=559627 RepID=UPI0020A45BFD|nr:hypothetical protein [Actinomadura rupiterrae]MCP2342000.1 hypothetical protein [Actinomadura rupiterrae]
MTSPASARRWCGRLLPVLLIAVGICLGAASGATAGPATPPPHPPPAVPLPTHPPWIQAPGGQPGQPVVPEQPIPKPGSVEGPGADCQGKSKVLSSVGAPAPLVQCQKPGGQWTVDPNSPFSPAVEHLGTKKKDECSFLDVPCQARQAVTGWFVSVVASAIGPTFRFLGATVFATPNLHAASMQSARDLWGVSQWIADTCFVLLVTLAGVLLMSGSSLPREYSIREVLPRLVWAFVAANLSLLLLGYGIDFANGLANAFLEAGRTHINLHQAAQVIGRTIETEAKTGSYLPLLAIVAVVLAACVACVYITRLAITVVLIVAAPLALMCHALPFTEGLALLWWRAITGVLAIQVCQSLVFVTALQVLLSFDPHRDSNSYFFAVPLSKADGVDLLLIIALLWVLLRIPSWVARTIWRQARPGTFGGLLKTFLVYRTIGAVTSAVFRTGRTSRGRRPPGGQGHPPHPPRPTRPKRPGPTSPTALPTGQGDGPNGDPVIAYRVPRPPDAPLPNKQRRFPQQAPPGWNAPATPPARPGGGGRATQLALPIPIRPAPSTARPVQLALPVDAPRVPRPEPPPLPPARPVPRNRQLQLPGMPKRPVPPRQMTLWIDRGGKHRPWTDRPDRPDRARNRRSS